MSYSIDHLRTAGKITVYTTLIGVVAFAVIFIFNIGEQQIKEAVAQDSATTTVTVLNIAPSWTASTTEVISSSTTTPTDAGNVVSWTAIGTDSNAENYWLLICSTSATPTPNSPSMTARLGVGNGASPPMPAAPPTNTRPGSPKSSRSRA